MLCLLRLLPTGHCNLECHRLAAVLILRAPVLCGNSYRVICTGTDLRSGGRISPIAISECGIALLPCDGALFFIDSLTVHGDSRRTAAPSEVFAIVDHDNSIRKAGLYIVGGIFILGHGDRNSGLATLGDGDFRRSLRGDVALSFDLHTPGANRALERVNTLLILAGAHKIFTSVIKKRDGRSRHFVRPVGHSNRNVKGSCGQSNRGSTFINSDIVRNNLDQNASVNFCLNLCVDGFGNISVARCICTIKGAVQRVIRIVLAIKLIA